MKNYPIYPSSGGMVSGNQVSSITPEGEGEREGAEGG